MSEFTMYRFDANGHCSPAYTCSIPGDNSGWFYSVSDVDAELIAKLRAENRALREALEAVEWGRDGFYDVLYCPCCGNVRSQGHTGDCKLGNALKQARGER